MSVSQDTSFARLVSLACHDLRTPLATVHGFARTISRTAELEEPASRYVEMIEAASGQLAELLDELGLVARIEAGRYDPATTQVDLGELARTAAARLDPELVGVEGAGEQVTVDAAATERSLAALVRCALRHGGLERVDVRVEGREVRISPITPASAPVVLGEDLRVLRAAVAVLLVLTLGGTVELADEVVDAVAQAWERVVRLNRELESGAAQADPLESAAVESHQDAFERARRLREEVRLHTGRGDTEEGSRSSGGRSTSSPSASGARR